LRGNFWSEMNEGGVVYLKKRSKKGVGLNLRPNGFIKKDRLISGATKNHSVERKKRTMCKASTEVSEKRRDCVSPETSLGGKEGEKKKELKKKGPCEWEKTKEIRLEIKRDSSSRGGGANSFNLTLELLGGEKTRQGGNRLWVGGGDENSARGEMRRIKRKARP